MNIFNWFKKKPKLEVDKMREFFEHNPSKIGVTQFGITAEEAMKMLEKGPRKHWPEYIRDSKGGIVPIFPNDRISIH